ncbi:glycoside hydrolase family 32 protein [Bacteroidota bacterium]
MKSTSLSIHFKLSVFLALLFSMGCNAPKSQKNARETYLEQHRPQYHFTPDSMWMNDPNGLVYYDGEYHLFYQHNPDKNVWGPMHWGHAVSEDLVNWDHLPVALYPDSLGTIFSGSAVIDWNNSSGLQNGDHPPMVAIFTYHNMKIEQCGIDTFQYQGIAYSNDRGRSWIKYDGNPILRNPGIRDFRDPKVIWFEEGQKWIMVLAVNDRVYFYSSQNLIDWAWESEFGSHAGAHGGVWECPELLPLYEDGVEKWILVVSVSSKSPNGGSGTQYFVGKFDGSDFINENPGKEAMWLDYGRDNYAGVTFSDIPEDDGRRILVGWMSNWEYAQIVPTGHWRNAMTIPRELHLSYNGTHYEVFCRPVAELDVLRKDSFEIEATELSGNLEFKEIQDYEPSLYEINLEFNIADDTKEGRAVEFGFILANTLDEHITVGYNILEEFVFIDRTKSGKDAFSEQFPGLHKAPIAVPANRQLRMKAYIDKASIELFINDGKRVMTEIFFPNEDYNRISLYANNGSVELRSGSVYSLKQ